MRNTLENKFVHVLSPSITKIMQETYQLYDNIKHGNKTAGLHDRLNVNLHSLHDYIECVGDLFKHKFLLFLCNHSEIHWYTFVVVNPSVIYLRGHSTKKWNDNSHIFAGWSVFDWTGWRKTNQPNLKDNGLMMMTESKFDASCGIHFFLNFCATYLYSKEDSENRKKPELTLKLKYPFGPLDSSEPSVHFPRFNYPFPSILQQKDTFNCGFAAVANAFAFVKHLRNVQFDTKHMKMKDSTHYYLSEDHGLLPFWENAISYLKAVKGPGITIHSLLTELQKEHEKMLPDLSKLYHMEIKEREDSIKDSNAKQISDAKEARKNNLTKLLRKKR